jgi:hypothetical protein
VRRRRSTSTKYRQEIDEEERRDKAREKTDKREKMRSREKQPRKWRRQDGD